MIRIINGEVYDPINGINGLVKDICIEDGVIIPEGTGGRVIDATGMVVMPGGVEMHSHIAGPKVNLARKMRPEDHRSDVIPKTKITRSGTGGSVPTTFVNGYRYAALGYTTAFDAAIPPLAARHAHEELNDTPMVDKGFFILMGNNEFLMRQIAAGEKEQARHFAAWLLQAAKAYAIKIVNPGGVELWKSHSNVSTIDDDIAGFNVTPRQIIQDLAEVSMDLGLPHPVHIHCNNLGIAGNWETTLETMKTLDGRSGHLTHIQFHSYGGNPGELITSKAGELADYVNAHPNISVDVGQVMFGDTTSLTGDGPLAYMLHKVAGRKWINVDLENEGGCGIVPIEYKEKNHVSTTQWAIGLEWFLRVEDPWRIALTTDNPNGAVMTFYPRIIRLLMDREYRKDAMQRVNQKALEKTTLPDLEREYSLYEIAIITRAGPARMLGLRNRGHLGLGASGDVTIYDKDDDREKMFSSPRYVIKEGQILVEDGQIRQEVYGRTLFVNPAYDPSIIEKIKKHFEDYYTVRYENYPVQMDHFLHRHEEIGCRS